MFCEKVISGFVPDDIGFGNSKAEVIIYSRPDQQSKPQVIYPNTTNAMARV